MRILNIRPVPPGVGTRTLAHFDVDLTPNIRLYGMRLLERPDGQRLVYAPSSGGRRFATFSLETTTAITNAASAAYNKGRATANDRIAAA